MLINVLNLIWSWGAQYTEIGYTATDTISSVKNFEHPSEASTFGYDPNDRLASVARSGDPQGFSLDTTGNRTSQTRNGDSYTYALAPTSNRVSSD